MNYLLPKAMQKILPYLFSIAAWAAVVGCFEDRSAGTSSTTGNPVKVGFGFQRDGSPSGFTGEVGLFPTAYMPVFDTVPLAVYAITGDSLIFTKDSVELILGRMADSLLQISADSIFSFNAFLKSSDGFGAALLGIRYHMGKGFYKPDQWGPAGGQIVLGALSDYQGSVSVELNSRTAYFLYLPGTPFYSRLEEDKFSLKALPAGRYEPLLLPVPKSRAAGNIPIDSRVLTLGEHVVTGESKVLTPGEIKDTLRVPDEWWNKNFGQ